MMVISINPHKPVVKTGCGDNVVVGIFSFKVAILNGALQNIYIFFLNKAFHLGNLFLVFFWTALPCIWRHYAPLNWW